jgi:hypothetical protein
MAARDLAAARQAAVAAAQAEVDTKHPLLEPLGAADFGSPGEFQAFQEAEKKQRKLRSAYKTRYVRGAYVHELEARLLAAADGNELLQSRICELESALAALREEKQMMFALEGGYEQPWDGFPEDAMDETTAVAPAL